MCDTWVATSTATLAKHMILGKNSDRPIFDCQPLVRYPKQEWPANSAIQLEYIELRQAEATYATMGSGPYWCWGYEEGINEHSVAIGNEAIFAKTFREQAAASKQGRLPELGLLGMDLVRLALERSQTAAQAVELIGSLVEQAGQFGSGVPTKTHAEGGYDNSFIVADPNEAWVVEAVGKRWAAKRVAQAYASISNQLSIRRHWDLGSCDIEAYALQKGWWPEDSKDTFDFARAYSDEHVPRQISHIRAMRSQQLLAEKDGAVTLPWMMRIARDHYEDTFLQGPYFDAADPDFLSICMHVSPAEFTWGNTASSCVAVLPKSQDELPVFWWTPGPPCNGCYVPFFIHGSTLPAVVSRAGTFGKRVMPPDRAEADTFSPDSYWWLFRCLMDKVKGHPVKSVAGHYESRNRVVRSRFAALEQKFQAAVPMILKRAVASSEAAQMLDEFTEECVQSVVCAVNELLKELD